MEAARQAQAAAERESRAAAARRELEKEAVSAAQLRKIRAHRVSMLKASSATHAAQSPLLHASYKGDMRTNASHTLHCD